MNALGHAALGAAAGLAPDVALVAVHALGRRRWLPPDHPAVRAHRLLHHPAAVAVALAAAYATHLVADRLTAHYIAPGVKGARGRWEWS